MNVQINSIESLRKKILDLIEEMRTNNKFNKINEVQKLQENFWKSCMQRDVASISEEKRNNLVKYMSEYVSLGIDKGFFNRNNILDVLEQLTLGNSHFLIMAQGDRASTFAAWGGYRGGGTYNLNPDCMEGEYSRHVVFHELSHSVTPDLGELYEYKQEDRKKSIVTTKFYMLIRELIAEYMACELSGGYKARTRISRGSELSSDWWTLYNKTYQQLGDDFLQTLPFINTDLNKTDRDRFRTLTMMALNPHNKILKMIIDTYNEKNPQNGINDLREISRSFDSIYKQTSATEEQISRIRSAMSEYLPENWREDEYLENVVETEPTHITPQNISNATRASVRINPEKVLRKVDEGRIQIKTGIAKNNPNRNK